MRRVLALLACLAALSAPSVASAHPLGNFTVNRHAAVELSGGRIYVRYVARPGRDPDVPARRHASRKPGFARRGRDAARAHRRRPAGPAATCSSTGVERRPGAGGLETLRFDAVYAAAPISRIVAHAPRPQLRLADRLARDRRSGPRRRGASRRQRAGGERERRAARLPEDLLRSPLDVSSATARFTLGRRSRYAALARAAGTRRSTRAAASRRCLPRRALARRDPALARARRLLGRRSRAHARAREGDRRRLSGRHEGAAARRRAARRRS